jgi:N5-(cytidine 5'-diphosphoramidyl)-L-glutamine hydrolase
MLRVGLTQRVDHIHEYGEYRDCLDQQWYKFFIKMGFLPIPLPNLKQEYVCSLLDELSLDAIVLTGGNSLSFVENDAKDVSELRDSFETQLFKEATKRNISILGICRGMQIINIILGGSLSKVANHVAIKHNLKSLINNEIFEKKVNSYHRWGIANDDLSGELNAIAVDEQGNIEAFIDNTKSILGIMWHPEREKPFSQKDLNLIKKIICKQEL